MKSATFPPGLTSKRNSDCPLKRGGDGFHQFGREFAGLARGFLDLAAALLGGANLDAMDAVAFRLVAIFPQFPWQPIPRGVILRNRRNTHAFRLHQISDRG